MCQALYNMMQCLTEDNLIYKYVVVRHGDLEKRLWVVVQKVCDFFFKRKEVSCLSIGGIISVQNPFWLILE